MPPIRRLTSANKKAHHDDPTARQSKSKSSKDKSKSKEKGKSVHHSSSSSKSSSSSSAKDKDKGKKKASSMEGGAFFCSECKKGYKVVTNFMYALPV